MADNRRVLYLGLEVPPSLQSGLLTHCPLIRISPFSSETPAIAAAFSRFNAFTHLLFTSRSAVDVFFSHAKHYGIKDDRMWDKSVIVVGKRTAEKITHVKPIISENETAEGVVELLGKMDLAKASILWPRSALARPVIDHWLKSHGVSHVSCPVYTTLPVMLSSPPNLEVYDEIVFTSPSTVDAFILNYRFIPKDKLISCIGPVTTAYLEKFR